MPNLSLKVNLVVAVVTMTALAGCGHVASKLPCVDLVEDSETYGVIGDIESTETGFSMFLGDFVVVNFEIQNPCATDGAFTMYLLENGEAIEDRTFRLQAGATEISHFEYEPRRQGDHSLQLAASVISDKGRVNFWPPTFTMSVVSPPDLRVVDVDISPKQAEIGQPVTVTAQVQNVGSASGTRSILLWADLDIVAQQSVTLAGGESSAITFTFTQTAPGDYNLRVTGFDGIAEVQFFNAAKLEFLQVFLVPSPVTNGELATLHTQIRNAGEREAAFSVTATAIVNVFSPRCQPALECSPNPLFKATPVEMPIPEASETTGLGAGQWFEEVHVSREFRVHWKFDQKIRVDITSGGRLHDSRLLDATSRGGSISVSHTTPYGFEWPQNNECIEDRVNARVTLKHQGDGPARNASISVHIDTAEPAMVSWDHPDIPNNFEDNSFRTNYTIATMMPGDEPLVFDIIVRGVEHNCKENQEHKISIWSVTENAWGNTAATGVKTFVV